MKQLQGNGFSFNKTPASLMLIPLSFTTFYSYIFSGYLIYRLFYFLPYQYCRLSKLTFLQVQAPFFELLSFRSSKYQYPFSFSYPGIKKKSLNKYKACLYAYSMLVITARKKILQQSIINESSILPSILPTIFTTLFSLAIFSMLSS